MSGQWVYQRPPKPPKHDCSIGRPELRTGHPGDIWLCECGKRWRIGKEFCPPPRFPVWRRHLRPLWGKRPRG